MLDPIDSAIRANPTQATIVEPPPGQVGYDPNSDNFLPEAPLPGYGVTGLFSKPDQTDGSYTALLTVRAGDIQAPMTPNQTEVTIEGVTYRCVDIRERRYIGGLNGYTLKLAK